MRAGADVNFGFEIAVGGDGGVVEEAEGAATGAADVAG